MAGSQFHNVSDVCSAMKEFTTSTSRSTAKGSFATQDMLTTFSEAITCLCDEVVQLRAELEDFRSNTRKAENKAEGNPEPPKPRPRIKTAVPKRSGKALKRAR